MEENRTYWRTWAALMGLLGLTVAVTGLAITEHSAFLNLLIASVKAVLVLLFFMHLRREGKFVKFMLLVTLAAFAGIIILTFSDVWFRG